MGANQNLVKANHTTSEMDAASTLIQLFGLQSESEVVKIPQSRTSHYKGAANPISQSSSTCPLQFSTATELKVAESRFILSRKHQRLPITKSSTMTDQHLSQNPFYGDRDSGSSSTALATQNNGLQIFFDYFQKLQNVAVAQDAHLTQQEAVIGELSVCNRNMHANMQEMSTRINALEADNLQIRAIISGNFPEQTFTNPSNRVISGGVKKRNKHKVLKVNVPDVISTARRGSNNQLPTPVSGSFTGSSLSSILSDVPNTATRVGPLNDKKATMLTTKRPIHDLKDFVPSTWALIPLLPLTDTEIIVFFFESLCRPIVTLRLYSRNWGPATITQALNDHRIVSPTYLRNTCSVKCSAALKRGEAMYGEGWKVSHRDVFESADPGKATDLIQIRGSEIANGQNSKLIDLCKGLRKYPEEGVDGGIFTRCVQYCMDNNNSHYDLTNVWELAAALESGTAMKHTSGRITNCRRPSNAPSFSVISDFALSSPKKETDEADEVEPEAVALTEEETELPDIHTPVDGSRID